MLSQRKQSEVVDSHAPEIADVETDGDGCTFERNSRKKFFVRNCISQLCPPNLTGTSISHLTPRLCQSLNGNRHQILAVRNGWRGDALSQRLKSAQYSCSERIHVRYSE